MPSAPAFARLGVHPTSTGGELRVWSEHASSMRLVLFDPDDLDRVTGERDMHRMKKNNGTWHIATRELAPGAVYALRVDGPRDAAHNIALGR